MLILCRTFGLGLLIKRRMEMAGYVYITVAIMR